ncbi:aldose epimerase family protein [Methylobacterium brachythecii]|uniref:Aldose 1-epimerase n=1 Tax=Methylobacterium brachythecii TaxID=1176177 RepID=A0A7W6AGX7_9HYPH|nr:aldose epimerase family protein [Methylobacterium brachythecii]MBB3901230.1 aldose 1-epimerase [Methylobacterium brachythecii]GLS44586.1 aldose 1-epimerase [Methylobacterium brachythecii]
MAGEIFGKTKGGEIVSRLTLERGNFRVQVLDYGGILTTIETPDREGRLANVVLGLDSVEGYETVSPHFGALAGRYANRIARGRFALDGTTYELPINNPPNTLHGGINGFAKRLFRIEAADAGRVVLMRRSPDGEEGFPGNLDLEVVYSLPEDGVLRIDYRAFTDKPTVLNLTNHSYFNLAGEGSGDVMGHVVEIAADAYTPTDAGQIPTGEIRSVEGTPFDFRKPTAIGERIRQEDPQIVLAKGYDHNFVLRNAGGGLRPAASCHDPASGRRLDIATTQPAVQLYTGNNLDGTLVGPSKRTYRSGDGICFETQGFPDAPNHLDFPSTVLRPGAPFVSTTTYRFSVA